MRTFLIALIFCSALPFQGQTQEPQIGQTRAEIVALLGQPSSIYSPRFSKFYETRDRDIALASAGFVSDVYSRYYGGVEFSLKIGYWLDDSTSRLHPTERVTGIELTPDKDQPFIQLASLLPWTKQLCATGCKLLGTLEGYSYYVYVYPKIISPEQSSISEAVANHFAKPVPSAFRFVPCLEVKFRQMAAYRDRRLPQFNSLTVDTLTFTIFSPETKHDGWTPLKEGEWVPGTP